MIEGDAFPARAPDVGAAAAAGLASMHNDSCVAPFDGIPIPRSWIRTFPASHRRLPIGDAGDVPTAPAGGPQVNSFASGGGALAADVAASGHDVPFLWAVLRSGMSEAAADGDGADHDDELGHESSGGRHIGSPIIARLVPSRLWLAEGLSLGPCFPRPPSLVLRPMASFGRLWPPKLP